MMAYEQFFGLNDAPFSLAPNPRYLFDSASHSAALEQLTYAIARREPLIVMTGEIGTGKTLLCRTVLQRLDRKTFVSVINDPHLQADDLLIQMLQDFGIMSTDRTTVSTTSRHDLVHALEDFLSSLIVLNAHAVVIIDEAQHVKPDVLEQVRLLSNIDAPGGTMLQIILAGQLDLDALLTRPELRQIQQRVSRRIRLEPLEKEELRSYIDHRLAVSRAAGSKMPGAGELARALVEWEGVEGGGTFTPEAVDAIWRWSGGLPRVVNLLCDRALEAACAQSVHTIEASLIDGAAAALGLRADAPVASAVATSVASPVVVPAATLPERTGVAHAGIWEPPVAEVPAYSGEGIDPGATIPQTRTKLLAIVAAVLAVVAVIAWFATRESSPAGGRAGAAPIQRPAQAAAPAAAPAVPSAAAPTAAAAAAPSTTSVTPPTPAPASAAALAPGGQTTTAPARTAAAPAPGAAAPGKAAFEIVVASFRTEPRAATVAAQVTAAGLNVRRREVGGWQQVIAGPFPTREEADAAHQRLERAGLPGTQVVASER
jgi:type II secretory pathway predicted ATPase ExeA